jgi:hypothetical protein
LGAEREGFFQMLDEDADFGWITGASIPVDGGSKL